MTRINLYPWRAAKEEYKKKQFLIILSCCCFFTLVFSYCQNWFYNIQIAKQESNNQYLNNELILTNKKLRELAKIKSQKQAILDRLSVLQKLDHTRERAIHLINQLVELINPLVVIKKIQRENDLVTISGYSESNNGVAKFLRDIELSPFFHSAELNKIQVMTGKNEEQGELSFQHYFELKFYQKFDPEKITDKEENIDGSENNNNQSNQG